MSTPGLQTNTAVPRLRRQGRRPLGGAATLPLTGLLSIALAVTLAVPAGAVTPGAPRDPDPSITGDLAPAGTVRGEAQRVCRPKSFYSFHHLRPRNFFVPRTRFIDGPGGTMTASVNRQHRVYAEMEVERERVNTIDREELVRLFRNLVNPLVAEEYVVESGHEYTQEISEGKYGNLWYRVFGYRTGFTAWRRVHSCRVYKVAAGIASIPARVEGWRYWETSHPMYRGRKLSER
ncbi:hypothetical protein [Streptosporangium sp. NPDC023615]|uniref:hypothetical protein n=1 Tax=Streptosporangium sp. NPDC023615 TaxID=3154794 RepID=UPI00342969CF